MRILFKPQSVFMAGIEMQLLDEMRGMASDLDRARGGWDWEELAEQEDLYDPGHPDSGEYEPDPNTEGDPFPQGGDMHDMDLPPILEQVQQHMHGEHLYHQEGGGGAGHEYPVQGNIQQEGEQEHHMQGAPERPAYLARPQFRKSASRPLHV